MWLPPLCALGLVIVEHGLEKGRYHPTPEINGIWFPENGQFDSKSPVGKFFSGNQMPLILGRVK